jgi:hypothetical protein
MKPANVPLPKEANKNKPFQRKLGTLDQKSRFKDQNAKRQRIGLYANAGHVRGGHSFH